MKKIVRLTESDLVKLVKRVIMEQQASPYETCFNQHLQAKTQQPNIATAKQYCYALADAAKKMDDSTLESTDNFKQCVAAVNNSTIAVLSFTGCVRKGGATLR